MRTFLNVVALVGTSLIISACGNSEAHKVRGEFIKGCMSTGQEKSLCSCAYEKLEEKYPTEQLKRLIDPSTQQVSEKFMRDTMNSMLVCAGRPPLPEPQNRAESDAIAPPEQAAAKVLDATEAAPQDSTPVVPELPSGHEDITQLDAGEPTKLAPGAYASPATSQEPSHVTN